MAVYIVSHDSKNAHIVCVSNSVSKEEICEFEGELEMKFEVYEVFGVEEIPDLPIVKGTDGIYLNHKSLLEFANAIVPFMGIGVSVREVEAPVSPKTHIFVGETHAKICIGKHTHYGIEFIRGFCKRIHSIELPQQQLDSWFEFHENYQFESFERAVELVQKLDSVCKTMPKVKKLDEDIAIIKTLTKPISVEHVTWKALKFNMAESAVCEALLRESSELWKLKTVQLIVLRWFLYERESTEMRSAQITGEFNAWLTKIGIFETISEVGTLLRLLGYTSRRVASGIRWDLSDKTKLADVAMLRETDIFSGPAQLFKIL